jgi:DNA-binding transcriptional ArsR family regulator
MNMAATTLEPPDQLSDVFSALADPTRRAILEHLSRGEATVNELAAPFPVSLQAVSKHLKVLERAGLVTRGRDAQHRPARLAGSKLEGAAGWLLGYRQFWDESFDRLDEHLRKIQGNTARAEPASAKAARGKAKTGTDQGASR